MRANRQAPVFAASETEIGADPDAVWDVLADFERWPSWNPDVKAIAVSGDVVPGTEFKWKAGRASITSTIERVERPRLLAWTGRTFGTSATHVYRLEASDGGTLVHTEESFEGWLPRLLRGQMKKTLERSLATGLRQLKNCVERGAGRP